MMGISDSEVKQKINLGNACWSLIAGFTVAMLVRTFRRRVMYLTCTISLLLCYIAWTISMERAVVAKESGIQNQGAAVATIFFIFAYSPCYNIGYNALTYSASSPPACLVAAVYARRRENGRAATRADLSFTS